MALAGWLVAVGLAVGLAVALLLSLLLLLLLVVVMVLLVEGLLASSQEENHVTCDNGWVKMVVGIESCKLSSLLYIQGGPKVGLHLY